jgi:hypothetical protein
MLCETPTDIFSWHVLSLGGVRIFEKYLKCKWVFFYFYKTPESVVCHSPDWCTIVNSSNKQQQRNNMKLWTEVHIFLAYSNRQKCDAWCKWNGSWITQILVFMTL